jgi:hypothetical protein
MTSLTPCLNKLRTARYRRTTAWSIAPLPKDSRRLQKTPRSPSVTHTTRPADDDVVAIVAVLVSSFNKTEGEKTLTFAGGITTIRLDVTSDSGDWML